jgi:hypothetical protein
MPKKTLTPAAPKAPRIITQHDFVSVDFGNGRRLTTSWSSQKATGAVPHAVFVAWCAMLDRKTVEGVVDITFGERIAKFVADINTIWPDWNKPPKAYTVGQTVTFDFGKRKGGTDTGVVVDVRRTNVFVKWNRRGETIGLTADMLDAGK